MEEYSTARNSLAPPLATSPQSGANIPEYLQQYLSSVNDTYSGYNIPSYYGGAPPSQSREQTLAEAELFKQYQQTPLSIAPPLGYETKQYKVIKDVEIIHRSGPFPKLHMKKMDDKTIPVYYNGLSGVRSLANLVEDQGLEQQLVSMSLSAEVTFETLLTNPFATLSADVELLGLLELTNPGQSDEQLQQLRELKENLDKARQVFKDQVTERTADIYSVNNGQITEQNHVDIIESLVPQLDQKIVQYSDNYAERITSLVTDSIPKGSARPYGPVETAENNWDDEVPDGLIVEVQKLILKKVREIASNQQHGYPPNLLKDRLGLEIVTHWIYKTYFPLVSQAKFDTNNKKKATLEGRNGSALEKIITSKLLPGLENWYKVGLRSMYFVQEYAQK